ncbi:MAG: WD40/YVTN/BNR-like repeat-containing protein [Flavobacteriales bacterium]
MKRILFTTFVLVYTQLYGQKKTEPVKLISQKSSIDKSIFSGLSFRSVGPANKSGRIADIAVNPANPFEYYLAVASGGVWKTTNAGNTYEPIFDKEGSYSIGCVTIDLANTNVIWVGTGENNNQRSVAYGDGVYKSEDGGKSWKNMGLKDSERIGNIVVHPKNSDIVYVAAYGQLWSSGGERGVYKTTDGGKSWERILHISENTGVNEIHMDPRNPDVLYAAAHQRRRHVHTYIGGGSESGLYKSTDGGKTWDKINKGLPSVEIGRIGLGISPVNPDVIYAVVEAAQGKGGVYRSTNRGANWEFRSSYSTSGNYYQEIYCDPKEVDKVFFMDTWLHHSSDGGKTVVATGEKYKHVDNHCMWIDPNNTSHWLVGCDGGLYETWNHGTHWAFKPNLPITQFYKVTTDNSLPFYFIYGGTQDNNSMGGPSATTDAAGISNHDWFITNGGDGFESQVDPTDPNIVYAQAQYGWLVRYDKKSGEKVGIQPQPAKGEAPFRWNWDAPLLISPHNHKRIYFAANRVFKSDDRGDNWTTVSPDLTRQLDRNKMKVMDRLWSFEAVMKNMSTSIFGNIVALDESPKKEGLLYVGTDDGLIQVSENGGKSWSKIDKVTGVPEMTYVNQVLASQHDENRVYAVFNNHKNGDFKPYVFVSNNKGKSWDNITSNLPVRGTSYAIAEDHINPNLLFVGTEFGVFFTIDGSKEWYQLNAGLPTIAVKDLAIQKREHDLVLATFGRGFYILDNYSPLRELTAETLKKSAHIFSIKTPKMFIPSMHLGLRGKADQGDNYYTAENPDFGAVFTYYLKDEPKTAQKKRREEEKKLAKEGKDIFYPEINAIRAEKEEEEPYLLFIVKDEKGNVVRKIKTSPKKGINRVSWNLRIPSTTPIRLEANKPGRYGSQNDGPLALPGKYSVELFLSENGELKKITDAVSFEVEMLNNQTLAAKDKEAIMAFNKQLGDLRLSIKGASELKNETDKRISHIKYAAQNYPSVSTDLLKKVKQAEKLSKEVEIILFGDAVLAKLEMETYPSVNSRVDLIVYQLWNSTVAPTGTHQRDLKIAQEEFTPALEKVRLMVKMAEDMETELDKVRSPYTPGRDGKWRED